MLRNYVNPTANSMKPQLHETMAREDLFGRRLFLLSLAFSGVAFCASSLLIPMLIAELDDLTELAERENGHFKAMADAIWMDLMKLQRRPYWDGFHSQVVQLSKRPERELQMSPVESKSFLDRLERKSFKGRQRLKGMPVSNAFHPVEVVAPRARSWSFAATTYDGDQTTNLNKPINQDNFAVGNGKCLPGPPGVPGLPGIDGVPGQSGSPGRTGLSGNEVQQSYENSSCQKCPAGLPGIVGPPGIPGNLGETGSPGLSGIPKNPSPAGSPGPVGEPGLPGPDGTDGIAGLPGVPGIIYRKGPIGLKGEIGLPGEPGIFGEPGEAGQVGMPGQTGWPGWPGLPGPDGPFGPIGPIGAAGIPGIEYHYCNCPIRTSQLMTLKDLPGGVSAYLGRWKGRLPNQLLDDYENFVKEKELEFKPSLIEVQN